MFLCMDEAEDEKYDLRKGLVRVREKEREREQMMWLRGMPEKQHYFKSYPSLLQVDGVRLYKPRALLKSTRKPRKPALSVPQRNEKKRNLLSLTLPSPEA